MVAGVLTAVSLVVLWGTPIAAQTASLLTMAISVGWSTVLLGLGKAQRWLVLVRWCFVVIGMGSLGWMVALWRQGEASVGFLGLSLALLVLAVCSQIVLARQR